MELQAAYLSSFESLVAPGPWSLCARNAACREDRLIELQEMAKGGASPEQAAILDDGIVTEDEHSSALRNWGRCIAQSTGAEVTFDGNGLFTVHESGEAIDAAFDRCQQSQVALVSEAFALARATG